MQRHEALPEVIRNQLLACFDDTGPAFTDHSGDYRAFTEDHQYKEGIVVVDWASLFLKLMDCSQHAVAMHAGKATAAIHPRFGACNELPAAPAGQIWPLCQTHPSPQR